MRKNTKQQKMMRKIKINQLLLLITVAFFLFIYPWTKEVKIFRVKDVNWEVLKSAEEITKFNTETFGFLPHYKLTDDILQLDGQKININGFFKKEVHGINKDFVITETLTDVCFMCDHDEHYNMIQLNPDSNTAVIFDTLRNDILIKVSGIFKINQKTGAHSVFLLKEVHLENVLN